MSKSKIHRSIGFYIFSMILGASSLMITACDDIFKSPSSPNEAVTFIAISPDTVVVEIGKSSQLRATVNIGSSSTENTFAITWTSLDSLIATVSDTGLVTGRSVGSTKIIATFGDKSDTALVSVRHSLTASITSINPSELGLGQRTEVTITGLGLQGATEVTLDRAKAVVENPPTVNKDGTQLTVFMTVPVEEDPGSAAVTVHTPQGNPKTSIRVVTRAVINSISPSTLKLRP
jgi:hypothetical protein